MDTSFLTVLKPFDHLTLDEATQIISQHPKAVGVMVVGSSLDSVKFKSYSDYDILIVWEEPRPIHVVLTYIDHRLADVVFTDIPTLEKLTQDQIYTHTPEASLTQWLRSGEIVYDRDGLLARLQVEFRGRYPGLPASKDYLFGVWFGVLYNFHQNWRMWESGDALYHQALHLRLLYGLWGIVISYFIVRELPWLGEKEAIRYWQTHDSDFHDLLQKTIAEANLADKMPAYRQLAELALEPVGGLQPDHLTIIEPVDITKVNGDFMQGLGELIQQLFSTK